MIDTAVCGLRIRFIRWPGGTSSSSRTRQNWGEDRVHLHDENGKLFSLPAGWTDVVAQDPFVVIAADRCAFTADGLLAVADLVDRFRAQRDGDRDVKKVAYLPDRGGTLPGTRHAHITACFGAGS